MLTKYVESLSANYFKVSDGQLLQIPTAFFITKYDTVYCKLRQVLQSAMIITIATVQAFSGKLIPLETAFLNVLLFLFSGPLLGSSPLPPVPSLLIINALRRSTLGNRVIFIFSGQKPRTRKF